MESVGEKIYDLRKKRGLSQDQLAKKIGVSRQTIYKWETDLAMPTSENVEALCSALGADKEYFYGSDPVKEETAPYAAETRITDPKREKSKRKKWIIASVISGLGVICLAAALAIYLHNLFRVDPLEGHMHVATTTSSWSVNWSQLFFFIGISLFVGVILFFAVKLIVKKIKSNKNPSD